MQSRNIKVEKVIVNVGIGGATRDKKMIEAMMNDLAMITGQKPSIRPARKAIAGFKIRQGMPVGLKVTLRGKRMRDFIDRLIKIALPRTRDFRGIAKKSFDGQGNLTIGIKEQTVFPEVSTEDIKHIFGLEITVVTTVNADEEGYKLLKSLGFPLK